jgi:hypothetical protein
VEYHLAQVNIARMLQPLDHPVMADFVNNLDRINALAEQSEGFVWRLVEDGNSATALHVFDDRFLIINMSVWSSIEALFNFTYKTAHTEVFRRRKEWFSKLGRMHMVCWYIRSHSVPGVEEAKLRLAYLDTHGETPYAFTFKSQYGVRDLLNYSPLNRDP